MPHSKGVMRTNPATRDRFRHGDPREDGFIFDNYDMENIQPNGFIHEQWRSPGNFYKKYKALTIKVNKWLNNKKLKAGCRHCGYKKYAVALVWHHVDPSKKEGAINKMKKNTLGRFKKIVLEIRKCIILCSNCHAAEHQKLREKNEN